MTTVLLGTPTTRDFDALHVSCLLQTDMDKMTSIWYPVVGQSIDVGRNIIVDFALKTKEKPDFLMFIDSDATWHPGAVKRLISRNLPVVTGVIFKRGLPPVPTFGTYAGRNAENDHMYNFGKMSDEIIKRTTERKFDLQTENALLLDKKDDDLVEIDGTGMHFCCIRRDVLEKIKPPRFTRTSWLAGEDFDFCRKVREAGIKIYADFSVYTGHIFSAGMEEGLREFLAFYTYTQDVDNLSPYTLVKGQND